MLPTGLRQKAASSSKQRWVVVTHVGCTGTQGIHCRTLLTRSVGCQWPLSACWPWLPYAVVVLWFCWYVLSSGCKSVPCGKTCGCAMGEAEMQTYAGRCPGCCISWCRSYKAAVTGCPLHKAVAAVASAVLLIEVFIADAVSSGAGVNGSWDPMRVSTAEHKLHVHTHRDAAARCCRQFCYLQARLPGGRGLACHTAIRWWVLLAAPVC